MMGNMYWNLYFAFAGGVMTLLFSWRVNPLPTSLWRSFFCFVILFLFMFAVRYILGKVAGPHYSAEENKIGQNIDLTTPEEAEEAEEAEEFKPLEPEKLAQVIRNMSEDEGR